MADLIASSWPFRDLLAETKGDIMLGADSDECRLRKPPLLSSSPCFPMRYIVWRSILAASCASNNRDGLPLGRVLVDVPTWDRAIACSCDAKAEAAISTQWEFESFQASSATQPRSCDQDGGAIYNIVDLELHNEAKKILPRLGPDFCTYLINHDAQDPANISHHITCV